MSLGRRRFLAGSAVAMATGLTAKAGADASREPYADWPPAGGESRFAMVGGVRLYYVVAGSGPPVVLLHGWPQTSFAWRETMARLAGRFTLIAPDLRGTGHSDRPTGGYDKRTIAADVGALIAALTVGRAHVVGHDMGGKAAFVLAHLFPKRVDRLVLVDCSVPGTENGDALRGGLWHYGFHAAPDFPEMLTQGRERDYIRAQIRAWSHRKDAVSETAIDEYARHYAKPGGMTAGFAYYRTLMQDAALVSGFADRSLRMPVLAIGGWHSVGERLAEALGRYAENLSSLVIEESGHFVPEEAPEAFCDALERFLAA